MQSSYHLFRHIIITDKIFLKSTVLEQYVVESSLTAKSCSSSASVEDSDMDACSARRCVNQAANEGRERNRDSATRGAGPSADLPAF